MAQATRQAQLQATEFCRAEEFVFTTPLSSLLMLVHVDAFFVHPGIG